VPVILLQTDINAPVQLVFDLSRSIDLHKVSTQHTNEEAIAGKTSGLIGAGESVTWRAKHFGIYQTLTSKITEYQSPHLFVDEMVDGAFKQFRHEHRFEAIGDGHTRMHDTFDYTSPLGPLGKLADLLFLKRYMSKLLEKRNQTIKQFAENGRWKEVLHTSR
jgi:ligand-binding SRPBCC domain-containing protein